MKKYIVLFLLVFMISAITFGDGEKLCVAVIDLKPVGIEEYKAQTASDLLRTGLVNTERFIVLERSEMELILNELGFQESGCTDATCGVQIGKMLSAHKIIIGTLAQLENKIIINIRLVDVEKSSVDYAGQYVVEKESDIIDGCAELAIDLTEKVYGIEMPRDERTVKRAKAERGKVKKGEVCGIIIAVEENKAVLDIGKMNGVKKKHLYAIMEYAEKEYISKITGKKEILTEKKKIGTILITEVDNSHSRGKIKAKGDPKLFIGKEIVLIGYHANIGFKAGGMLSPPPLSSDHRHPGLSYMGFFSYETHKFLFRLSMNFERYGLIEHKVDLAGGGSEFDYYYYNYSFNQLTFMIAYKPVDFIYIGLGAGYGNLKPYEDNPELNFPESIISDYEPKQMTAFIDMGLSIPIMRTLPYPFIRLGLIVRAGKPYSPQDVFEDMWGDYYPGNNDTHSELFIFFASGIGF